MIVIVLILVGILLLIINRICIKKQIIYSVAKGLIFIGILIELFGFLQHCESYSKYDEWKLKKQTELVSLANTTAGQGAGIIFVSISADNVYSYRYEINSKFGTNTSKEYVVDIVSENVEEVEDPNCKIPLLKEYNSKFRIGFWRVAFQGEATRYAFYVPEGTIQKQVQLN